MKLLDLGNDRFVNLEKVVSIKKGESMDESNAQYEIRTETEYFGVVLNKQAMTDFLFQYTVGFNVKPKGDSK